MGKHQFDYAGLLLLFSDSYSSHCWRKGEYLYHLEISTTIHLFLGEKFWTLPNLKSMCQIDLGSPFLY